MAIYFLLHDADFFHHRLVPSLTEAWRRRSFAPCRALGNELAPAIQTFAERYHAGPEVPLLTQVIRELPFDRDYWRLLISEALLYGAAEVPEIQSAADSLRFLLAPERRPDQSMAREHLAPIEQAHQGARDLFLGTFYRPEAAGWNDRDDVARLADYLAGCDPERWTVDDLLPWDVTIEYEECVEELAFARQCLLGLRDLYAGAVHKEQVVVCEVL